VVLAVLALLGAGERTARADGEAWLWVENRVPLARTDRPEAGRVDLRILGDFRWNGRSEGLGTVFARMGPLFFLSDSLSVGTHASWVSSRASTGDWLQQARLELEPNLFGRVGDFTFNDRNRGEYRIRDALPNFFYYRNQLRISYAPEGARWIPFVWDEVLLNATRGDVTENRASLGVGRLIGGSTRVDVGYVLRSRKDPTWTHDHVLNLYFFFDVPRPAPEVTLPASVPDPGPPHAAPPTPSPLSPHAPETAPAPAIPEGGG
jgi:hypothetical protein